MLKTISLLRLPIVKSRVGLGRSSIYKLVALGDFPAPQKLSTCGRVSVWPSNLIDDWVDRQMQGAKLRPAVSGKSARVAKVPQDAKLQPATSGKTTRVSKVLQ